MVIGENRGGSALVELGGGYGAAVANKLSFKCSPFNTVYMPNIKSKVRSNQGSNIIGLGAMYGNNSHNQVEINLYGNKDSYLLQSNGGYLISNCKKMLRIMICWFLIFMEIMLLITLKYH